MKDPTIALKIAHQKISGYLKITEILSDVLDTDRITGKDKNGYFAVQLDKNSEKNICRIYVGNKKYLGLFDNGNLISKYKLEEINDIDNFATELREKALKIAGN